MKLARGLVHVWTAHLLIVLTSSGYRTSVIASVTGSHGRSTHFIDVSTFGKNQLLQYGIDKQGDIVVPSLVTVAPTISARTRTSGFNLLWLISSRYLQNRPGFSRRRKPFRPNFHYMRGSTYSRRLHREGVRLHSNLPRRILRFNRLSKRPSNKTVQMKRVISGDRIGFEMELKVDNSSGSGYLITGRSLDSGEFSTKNTEIDQEDLGRHNEEDSSTSLTSWFGLFSRVIDNRVSLRLEYKNAAFKSKRKFIIALPHENFTLDKWHKLAVQIDFKANSIEYWVNCTRAGSFQVQQNKTFPTARFDVYRLLQHRNKAKMPVQVTFRSVIVTNGENGNMPKQCASSANVSHQECSGGRIFMDCGPSCERTCDNGFNSLHACSATCLRGCHCRPGQVYHREHCISPGNCPCRIGTKRYTKGAEVTINNEICTCVTGKWKCYAVASFTRTPRNETVRVGGSVNLTCGVSGNPLPKIRWHFTSGVSHFISNWNGKRNSQLSLFNISAADAGIYTCTATRQDGWTFNASALVVVTSPPVITSLPATVTATLGSPVTSIDCPISGIPTPTAAWRKKGTRLRYFPVSRGILRLKIINVNRSDAGEYKCVAINSAGRATRSVMLIVKLPAPSSMAFKKQPHDRCVKPGHTAVFPCQVIDHGKHTNVTWFKDGKPLFKDNRRIIQRRHKLVIRKVTRDDAGTYTCLVTMTTSDMQAKGRLMIKGRMQEWSSWSACTASCGQGYTSKVRKCTGIPPNKKTCHGKFEIVKPCNTHMCPGICSSYGDPHYTTFDGRMFNFQGDCSYILTHDVIGNDFKIVQFNVGCGSRLSCVRKISVVLAFPTISAVVDIEVDQTVYLNGVLQATPFLSSNGVLSVAKIGLYMILRVTDSLEIRWATPHRLYVMISGRYASRTQGLCGNFNRDPNDDNLTPSGRLIESDLEFGQSWALKDGNANYSCSAVSTLTRPCSRNAALAETARGACLFLLNKKRFGRCHKLVSPGSFVTSCMLDICSTSMQDTNMYFCIALSAYSAECLRRGIVLNWRTSEICPVNCTGGMLYSECGPPCIDYCPSDISGGSICDPNKRCVAGCFCREGEVLHNGQCISLLDCPCTFNGMTFSRGARHDRNCQRCICRSGGWQCVFNNQLCDYPASVSRGPQSQIVPFGHSVTFCCGVVGIPSPSVEWYRDGQVISNDMTVTNREGRGSESNEDLNATLLLRNVSQKDAGSYTCKAVNEHGSHNSNPATLTIIDPTISSCDPNPAFNYVHLPEGCHVLVNGRAENVVNLGRCLNEPCYMSRSRKRRESLCNPTQHCCQPSVTEPVLVRCIHSSYVTSFLVTVVRHCACSICTKRTTVVEGVVKSSDKRQPVKHVKISYRGRTVGYTSSAGSFRIRFPNLSLETRHVTVMVTDVMFRKYATTIKNLLVLPGESTIHTLTMSLCKERLRFNATHGLRYTFRPSEGYSHRMRLIIPPNSLILNRRTEPFRGVVMAGISLIDKKKMNHEIGDDSPIPGSSLAINIAGEEQILSPSVVLCISLYNRYGRPLDLLPGKFASLSLTTNGMRAKLLPWTLDDLTGYWRESGDQLEVVPHHTKRGDKVFIATARISRFDTAWALGARETPCYLRVRVLDSQNQTVSAVRVAFAPRNTEGSEYMLRPEESETTDNQTKPLTFSSYVEDLTSSRTFANGVCLPVGCHDTGMLHASRIGNELVMLQPETPPSVMGQVREYRSMSENASEIFLSSKVLDTSLHIHTNASDHYAYFRTKADCRDTRPSLQTYVFRDRSDAHDGSVLSRFKYNYHNRVILTFGMLSAHQDIKSERQSDLQPRYCHMKVQVHIHPSFALQHAYNAHQSVVEAVTYLNDTSNSDNSLVTLGWRRMMLKPFSSPIDRDELETQNVCVEYICGGTRLSDSEHLVLRLTIRHTSENFYENDVEMLDRPRCNFTISPPSAKRKNFFVTNSVDLIENAYHFNHGGYVNISKKTNSYQSRRRYDRNASSRRPKEFSGRTLAESKQHCAVSPPNEQISAYFECL